MMKAEMGALSSVTDLSLRLPVHRWKGPGDHAGQCTGKCRDGPCKGNTLPLPLPLDFRGVDCIRSFASLWITIVRRDLTVAAFA